MTPTLTILLSPTLGGWCMVWSDARPWTPQINAGHAYRIVDATGAQVGAIVQPVSGYVNVMGVVTWTCGQLDFDASGNVDTADFLTFHDLYDAGSCLCDFDSDGIVRWEDGWAFDNAWHWTYLADFAPFDGYISADDFDRFISAFVAGDPAADVNGDSFVSGDDHDLFTTSFLKGIP